MMLGFKHSLIRLFVICVALVLHLAGPGRGAETAADSDGDGMPDEQDGMPTLANMPIHWSVQSLTLRWAGAVEGETGAAWDAAGALTIFSLRERGDMPGSRPGACATASPLDNLAGDPARGNGLPLLGTFGSGDLPWQAQQRLRAERFSRNPAGGGRAVELVLDVYFRNFSDIDWMIKEPQVPLLAGKRRLATARPANHELFERGIMLPGARPQRVYSVPFVAVVPPEAVDELFRTLARQAPSFAFDQAEGQVFSEAAPAGVPILDWFGPIHRKTVAVKIVGGDGQVLVWRVAREAGGVAQTVGTWAATVNALSQQAYGRPFWLEEQGFLTSLAGWDTGAWDRWWRLSGDDAGSQWASVRLNRDVAFVLHDAPPTLARAEMNRLNAIDANPILLTLAGRHAWLEARDTAAAAAYRRAAELNYAPGQNWFGFCLAEGRGVDRNAAEAVRYYAAAAGQNYAPGQAWMGGCLLRGNGTAVDHPAAFSWLAKAAAQGHPEGSAIHALCLTRGVGTKADPAKGLQATRRAAFLDSPTAQLAMGIQMLEAGNPEGVDWLHTAARAGDAKAQTRYARCLAEGTFVPQDIQAAMTWFAQAAEQGDAAAQVALGRALRSGTGVKRRNSEQAAHWFRQAAEQGHAEAQTWTGLLLLDGRGVKRNPAEGIVWIRQAAEKGFAQAQYLLGLCLFSGFGGTEQAPAEALKWFTAAAEQQVLPARIFVGFCYYEGRGVAQDRGEAFRHFEMAATAGSAVGQIWTAHCLAYGEGTAVDLILAYEWAQKAWQQGHPGGRQMLRTMPRE